MSSDRNLYFQLLDAFAQDGCAVCAILRTAVRDWIAAGVRTPRRARRLVLGACDAHARLLTDQLRGHEPALRALLAGLRAMRPSASPPPGGWLLKRRPRRASYRCALCGLVEEQEPTVVHAFLEGLREMQFIRAFRAAAPVCLTHEMRLLAAGGEAARELAELQGAKLAGLNDQLLRHEVLADTPESVESVLRYLGAEQEAAPWAGRTETAMPAAEPDTPATDAADSFEVAKLQREVQDLTRRLGEAESRAAGLHYRVAVLSEDNRNWELRYTGLAAEARSLQAEIRAARAKEGGER